MHGFLVLGEHVTYESVVPKFELLHLGGLFNQNLVSLSLVFSVVQLNTHPPTQPTPKTKQQQRQTHTHGPLIGNNKNKGKMVPITQLYSKHSQQNLLGSKSPNHGRKKREI